MILYMTLRMLDSCFLSYKYVEFEFELRFVDCKQSLEFNFVLGDMGLQSLSDLGLAVHFHKCFAFNYF